MKALVKIAPIVIIIACAASLFFAFRLSSQKTGLKKERDEANSEVERTTVKLGEAQKQLSDASAELSQSKNDLTAATASLAAKDVELGQKKREAEELAQAKAKAEQDFAALKEKADATEKTMADLQAKLGAADITNIEELGKKVQALTDENKMLGEKVTALTTEKDVVAEQLRQATTTPADLRGRVALAKGQWNFLIMDIGRESNVQPNSEFLVYRDSSLVAKAKVTVVYPNSSVADLVPGFMKSLPREGDSVVFKKM